MPEDAPALREALAVEHVYWVKAALTTALTGLGVAPQSSDARGPKELELASSDLPPHVVNEAARLLLHELRAPIGRVDAYASIEVRDFAESSTQRELQLLKLKLQAIDKLGQATSPPGAAEFDLGDLLARLSTSHGTDVVDVLPRGPKPLVVISDESLVELIVSNALRNAIEASTTNHDATNHGTVVLSWGVTEKDTYIRIVDDGPGLAGPVEQLAKWGRTTKKAGHGYGLATAIAAARSLGGHIELSNTEVGGARFEFRWTSVGV